MNRKRALDLTGQVFGRLRALHLESEGHWRCECECGNQSVVITHNLRSGNTQSCGCLQRENLEAVHKTHGLSKHPLYVVWQGMKQRCTNPKNGSFKNYGGRGITVCERWMASFPDFLADMGERPEGHSINRVNNDGPYSPANCVWATDVEQCVNRRRQVPKK